MVMTEQFYGTRKPVAEKFMRCFVQATKAFIADPALASKYVRETIFKGQITLDDFEDAIGECAVFLRHHARAHPGHDRHHGQNRGRAHAPAARGARLGAHRAAGGGEEKPERELRRTANEELTWKNGTGANWQSAWWCRCWRTPDLAMGGERRPGQPASAAGAAGRRAQMGGIPAAAADASRSRAAPAGGPGLFRASWWSTPSPACTGWWSASPSAAPWRCPWAWRWGPVRACMPG